MKDLTDLIDDLTTINANLQLEHRRWSAVAEDFTVPPDVTELRRQHWALGLLINEADALRRRLSTTSGIAGITYPAAANRRFYRSSAYEK